MTRVSLSKDEKARIIDLNGKYPQQRTYIAYLLGRPESTVRYFYKRFQMTGHIEEKQGRPPISPEKQKEVVDYFEKQPESTLRIATSNIDISISKMRGILNQNQIHYMKKIPIPNLTDQHKEKRVQFSNYICNFPPNSPPKLIITDESTVEENLLKGGIWRRRGHYPPGSFKGKDAHPIHVMVWGDWPWRLQNQVIKYIELLTENEIFIDLYNNFQNDYIFQQDNAPCHVSKYIKSILNDCVPEMIDWPAKSPDLSPIEQIWNFLKHKLVGINFQDTDSTFSAFISRMGCYSTRTDS